MNIERQHIESFSDQRAVRYFDLFSGLSGQITISKVLPHQFSGWHKHLKQTDEFFVAEGLLKVAIINPNGEITEELLSPDEPKTIKIYPNQWHSGKSYEHKTILIYHLNKKHNESDEFRATEEEIIDQFNYKI